MKNKITGEYEIISCCCCCCDDKEEEEEKKYRLFNEIAIIFVANKNFMFNFISFQ